MVDGTAIMDEEAFDRLTALRLPCDYPSDAASYADVLQIARRRQSAALRRFMGEGARSYGELVAAVNAVLGPAAVSDASLRNMRAGTSVMPPRVAVVLAQVLRAEPLDLLPHIEAFPWLGGRYRPNLAGRTWGQVAARFDVPLSVVSPSLRMLACPAAASQPARVSPGPTIGEISRSISRRTGAVVTPVHDPVPSRAATPCDGGVAAAQRDVMMSMTDVEGGVRLVYRGLVDPRRLDLIRAAVGADAWSTPGAWSLGSVDSRREPLFVCDMVVPADRTGRLLSAIGAPVPRRSLLDRLLGRR